MLSKNFVILSNQRSGSTWIETSLGNLNEVHADYEVKWSEELLITKKNPYHLFLNNNSFEELFNKFNKKNLILGTKFIFDFYKFFPYEDYSLFLSKFSNVKILHLRRNYIDILKSKLIGQVMHFINHDYFDHTRVIDKNILKKQEHYKNLKENNLNKSKEALINYDVVNWSLINLFINDIIALKTKENNKYFEINYEEINNQLPEIKNFLQINEDLNLIHEKFFVKPTIIKNNSNYKNMFENFEKLNAKSKYLQTKFNELKNSNFKIEDIILIDLKNKKVNLSI